MQNSVKVQSLAQLGNFIRLFLSKEESAYDEHEERFASILKRAELENPWFTQENLRFCLTTWADLLNERGINEWIARYTLSSQPKKIGLILAGNIPMVGFHDVVSVLISNHIALIKLSSKDRLIIPYLLEKWNEFSDQALEYEIVEKLENYDAVIATGSNNTARYLEHYFKNTMSIIRKNRTSVAVLSGNETQDEMVLLSDDIFRYFGLGCRNVSRIFLPQDMKLERLFESFVGYQEVIHHHKYANNYDYHRAIFLLNQDIFWDNNFVMLKEDESLFSPLSVIHFSRYENIDEVKNFLEVQKEHIQCVVSQQGMLSESVSFGQSQKPSLDTYADQVDVMEFLSLV